MTVADSLARASTEYIAFAVLIWVVFTYFHKVVFCTTGYKIYVYPPQQEKQEFKIQKLSLPTVPKRREILLSTEVRIRQSHLTDHQVW